MTKTLAIDWKKVADLIRAIADELEASSDGARQKPKKKAARRPRLPLAPPASQVSEADRQAARAHLRRNGFRKV